jgi:hypothetical protein
MLDSCGDLRYRRGAHRRRIRAGFLRKVTFDNMPGTGPLGYPALLSSPLFTNVVEEKFCELRLCGSSRKYDFTDLQLYAAGARKTPDSPGPKHPSRH